MSKFSTILIGCILSLFGLLLSTPAALAAPCDLKNNPPDFIEHDLSDSYCELCGYGYVTIEIANPYENPGAAMLDLVVVENLGSSGLSYAPGAPNPVSYRINGGPPQIGAAPGISGGGSILTFTAAQIPALALLETRPGNNQFNTLSITFAVSRDTDPEGLVGANRTIQATLNFATDSGCSDSPQSDIDTLPLREPLPVVSKTGWNYDAGQRQSSQSDPVYGTSNDDVVWRVRIANNGLAGLQDLRFDDLMEAGSLVISNVCATAAAANSIAANDGAGSAPGCVASGNIIDDFIVSDPFGDMGLSFDGHEIDVNAGGSASLYLVGKITADGSCVTSRTNSVNDVQWGCEAQPPAGGISQTSGGTTPADTATIHTRYNDGHPLLSVERRLTGINTSQPVGSKGTMTITIRNTSGGSVKNIHLTDLLPPEYVIDPTFPPELDVNPAYGTYPGLIDTLTWTNENSVDPLANIAPEFDLTSNGVSHPLYPDQLNMLRQGDVAVVTFRVVLIEADYYDRNANLDVNPEEFPVTGTDPEYQTPLSNTLTVDFETFCPAQGAQALTLSGNGTGNPAGGSIAAFPEDLDIVIGGDVFILTNDPNQLLTLPILLTNNGGHDAADYQAFVSFGATMEVVNAPAGCGPIALSGTPNQPDPWKTWVLPAPLPATATVYQCSAPASIAPGQTVSYNFDVRKTSDPARILLDDLSLRADVVGEITLSDGTPLWFPAPLVRPDGELDRANNYSLDATWARVIGFNLRKTQLGTCNENNPPSYDANGFEELQIGEECQFHIETGGWFGFKTPGFAYIAVQNIDVTDQVPAGQAYLSSTDPYLQSTAQIANVSLNPAGLAALDEGPFDWRFNVPDSEQITVADEWFVVETKTRLLNQPIDQSLPPNVHAADSFNVLVSDFDATFQNDNTGLIEKYTLGPSTVGYPNEAIRRVDLTVTEPFLTVVKEVCNEALYGVGPGCSNFVPLADDGDAYNNYIYRLRVTNEASSAGVQRAPAYDVTVTDQLDASDLAYVFPFAGDGLDNDGDGASGAADADGEGSNSDNVVKNGVAAQLTFSYTHSSALLRIDPGQSVDLYYRVDYDDDAAPLQTFTDAATATYDSLAGASGAQSSPQRPNSDPGGARVYVSDPGTAAVRIIPVLTQPKRIVNLSNTPLAVVPAVQEATIGEELDYRLDTLLPVALLRSFVIRDELPAGLRCVEAPAVDLDAAPYAAAGFEPGGVIIPTCSAGVVEWNFGDQRLTSGSVGDRFDFSVGFIARLDNSALTNDGELIANGGLATSATAAYIDEAGVPVVIDFGQVDLLVREPRLELTKTYAVAAADAGDHLTVTVTATNSGTATAYNLRILDDLTGRNLSFIQGSVSGADPPDNVDITTFGANQPLFIWGPGRAIVPGASISFSFEVSVDSVVQPQEVLDNSIQASWTSLPAQTTALNMTGSIGAAGDLTGMRNGALPNNGDAVNDYEAVAAAQLPVSAVTLAKSDLAPGTVPVIGAHKQFRIEIALPEGVSTGVSVSDSLDAAGLSYLLADNAAFDISYSFTGIVSINGQPPGEAAFNAVPADGTSGSAAWDIGTVVTESENDPLQNAIDPVIRIDYFARVNNDLDTDAGDLLQNGATASYVNGETGADETLGASTPTVTVSEPVLTLSKVVANATGGKTPADPPVVGDILEYRITALNTGSSDSIARDVTIVDTLPAGLELDPGFTPTASIDAVPVAGFAALPGGAPAGPLVWGGDNGDGSLDIPAGQVLVLSYRTVVLAIVDPDQLIENGVRSDWTSLDGASPYERTGAGCPTITLPNDYCVGPVTATVIGLVPEVALQKTVSNATTGQDPGLDASPGDLLRYRLTATNIGAIPASFSLTDELDRLNDPPLFVPGTLTLSAGNPGTDASDPNGGSAGTGLVNVSDLSLAAGESLTVEFTVQLAPVIVDGTLALNQGQLLAGGVPWVNSDDPNLAGAADPTQTLIASAPAWLVEKTALDLTGAASVLFAGDQLRYTIRVKNIGSENATDVVLRDAIPADTTYIPGSTTLNGSPVADPAPGVAPLPGGILLNAPEDPTPGALRADASAGADNLATVSFDVQVDPAAVSGTVISNQGLVNGSGVGSGAFPEQPSDDPDTPAADDPTLSIVSSLDVRKAVFNDTSGGDGATASPGDTLRYRLEVSNTGTVQLDNLSLVDELEALQPAAPAFFVPGSLALVSLPPGADVTASDPAGGGKGTGLVDVRNLTLPAGETLAVEFTVQLAPVITSGTQVLNQAELQAAGTPVRRSDAADPALSAAEDPTRTLIVSAPIFEILKTSTILSGDPSVLMAGETLRYTLRIRNIGSENAVNAVLRDNIPANTGYLANSTTLNGVAVADPSPGVSPLEAGLAINAPVSATAGALPADHPPAAGNVATVSFDVVIDPTVIDGLVIENQGFLSAAGLGSGAQPDRPSDDPATPTPDDPTRNIVGNLPLLGVLKTVRIEEDFGSAGIVDPGDVLRYTIEVSNFGAIPATGVTLTDQVPADTNYVADSLRLNGAALGADGGVLPLSVGLTVESSDLPGAGIISAGGSALISFDVQVNAGVPTGTVISNQGSAASNELPDELTDADGLPANGYQPTLIVVGAAQLVTITKDVQVVGAGTAEPGGQLEYVVRVTNAGSLPATRLRITDDLTALIGQLSYVAGSGTLNGLPAGVGFAGSVVTADYAAAYGDLPPGDSVVLRFRVQIDPTLAIGTTLTNTGVVTWNDPSRSDSASVSLDLGGTPGSSALNGQVWHDVDLDRLFDDSETRLDGWTVELFRNNLLLSTILTDSDGRYRLSGLIPNLGSAEPYQLRFRAPGAGANTASLGSADSAFSNGPQQISDIVVASGGNLQNLNLPITPNGTVYDSVQRSPIGGARLALLNAATGVPLPNSCFADPGQQNQVTSLDGFYKFDINFSDPACPAAADYLIEVTPPAAGYVPAPSQIIPPASDGTTPAFSVPACPGTAVDAVPATAAYCEATTTATAPPLSVAPRTAGTTYYLHLTLDSAVLPEQSQLYNNPIPIDPELNGAVAITKTAAKLSVSRGALVPYTITVNNLFGAPLFDLSIVDRFPAGFKYVPNSARLDGVALEPSINGRTLVWDGLELQFEQTRTLQLLLVVGAGVGEDEYVNRAQAFNSATGGSVSGEATATVRVVPDPTFDCTDVIGKVFDDRNLNGSQDEDEAGLPGVRLVTARGLIASTDRYGRFHIDCAAVPDHERGSNFILKLDDRSLPSGYRLTTENPRVQRATRGKLLRFNFGATIHRVVTIDIAAAVYEPETTQLRLQWQGKLDQLLQLLKESPSVLRLSYLADVENPALVSRRLKALKDEIARRWERTGSDYRLTIETEVFWRRGAPP